MSLVEIFLIAVSLALDAFAVSVSSGISIPGFGVRHALKLGCWFGGFQFAMPLLGWLLGSSVSKYIQAVDHWVAFGLLAIATSIDALAVGVSMAFMLVNVLLSAAVIGAVAFALSMVGGLAGKRLGALFQKRAELAGGLVLIGIGLKILAEHTLGG